MKFVLVVAAIFAFNTTARADAPRGTTLQQLFSITNDRDKNKDTYNLMLDDKDVPVGMFLKVDPKATDGRDSVMWFRDTEKSDGAIVIESQGYKVLVLKGKLDRTSYEGKFSFVYLANGMMGKYESCEFQLKKKSDTEWYVKNAYNGKEVKAMKIVSWSMGLETLQGICK